MFILRKPPYGTRYTLGGLEAALVMGAYEQDISFLFIDDGVFSIKKGMDTTDIDMKNFSPTFRALEGFDIEKLYVDKKSMEDRGLTVDDFVVDVEVLSNEQVAGLLEEQDAIFPF